METICVQRREGAIKAKKLRRLGFIPANVFGKSLPDPISIQLKESDARRLLHQKREGSKLMLDLELALIHIWFYWDQTGQEKAP